METDNGQRKRTTDRSPRAARGAEALRYLEREVWPSVPKGVLGRRLTRREEDRILGYGPEGV